MPRYSYQDPTAARMARVLGTPLNDGTGRIMRGTVVVSGEDARRAAETRARNTELAAQTGARPLGGYEGDAANAAALARLDPRINPNLRPGPMGPIDPVLQAGRQQLSALNGMVPGRDYSPGALAKATLPQIQGELAALPERGRFVNDFLTRGAASAEAARLGEKAARDAAEAAQTSAETGALNRNADQLLTLGGQLQRPVVGSTPLPAVPSRGALVDGFLRNPAPLPSTAGVLRPDVRAQAEDFAGSPLATFRRMGGVITPKLAAEAAFAKPPKENGGFANAEEARASIPAGSKGQVSQNGAGRWIVQYQVGGEGTEPYKPQSSLAKLQADLTAARAAGRADEATQLEQQLNQELYPADRPMNREAWMFERNDAQRRKDQASLAYLGNSYLEYLKNNREDRSSTRSGRTAPPATSAAPAGRPSVQVKTKAERDALPDGARYIGPDGKPYTKKPAAPAR